MFEISIAANKSTSADRMVDFRPLPVHSLHALGFIITNRAWSPCVWSGGYRLKKNFLHSDFCALDFDTGEMTLSQAIKLLVSDNLAGIIGTTKSHQQSKDGKPACDRFRLILPWDGRITDILVYEQNMDRITKCLPADKACKDGGRFFFPCADVVYEQDGEKFSWLPYQQPVIRPPSQSAIYDRELKRIPRWMQAELSKPIPAGSRNRTAFRFAIHLKKCGFSETDTADILSSSVGLEPRELATTIRSAFRYV